MQRSTDRILTTHAGSLPMPADLHAMLRAKEAGQPYDAPALQPRLTRAVAEVVRQQAERLSGKFSFEAICGMISLDDQQYLMRERDDGDQFGAVPR